MLFGTDCVCPWDERALIPIRSTALMLQGMRASAQHFDPNGDGDDYQSDDIPKFRRGLPSIRHSRRNAGRARVAATASRSPLGFVLRRLRLHQHDFAIHGQRIQKDFIAAVLDGEGDADFAPFGFHFAGLFAGAIGGGERHQVWCFGHAMSSPALPCQHDRTAKFGEAIREALPAPERARVSRLTTSCHNRQQGH